MEGAKDEPGFVEVAPGGGTPRRIAFRRRLPRGGGALRPGLVFLGGFASDMHGSKASFLDAWAQREGRALLRFDYSGHGESDGRFEDGAIGDWLEDSLAATRRRPHALVLIAPAVDFTEELLWASADAEARRAILEQGVWPRRSRYAPQPTPITRRLIEEGRAHLLLGGLIRTYAPVTILQGMQDEDVPYAHALRLVERLPADPVSLSLIVDGDHRLSRRQDLDHLVATIEALG